MVPKSRSQLAHDLVAAGVTLAAGSDDQLIVSCARGPMPAGLRTDLLERKPEVLIWLRSLPDTCLVPTLCMALGTCPRARVDEPCSTAEENICAEHLIDTKEVA